MKSKLNGGNLVHGVNIWAVSLLKYSAAFDSWTAGYIDRKTRRKKRRRKRFDIH